MCSWLCTAAASNAQPILDSLRCGQAQLARALAAHGGEARIGALTQLAFRAEGPVRNAYQGFAASRWRDPEANGRQELEMAMDFAQGRYYQLNVQRLSGGLDLAFATLALGPQVQTLRLAEKLAVRSSAPSAEAAAAQVNDIPSRLLPPLLLRRARENLASVRCVAAGLDFSWDARTRISLELDEQHRVTQAQVPQPDPMDGEAVVSWRFSGQQTVAGIVWPQRTQLLRRGVPLMDLEISDLKVNAALEASRFVLPEGFVERNDSPALQTVKVADGLWEVRGIGGGTYRVPVLEAPEYLVVFDAPLANAVSRQVMAQIRQHIGAKPVRYVVLSHFHGDHSGGLQAWAEAGATLLVSPGDRAYVEQLLSVRSVLALPVTAAAAGPKPVLQTIDADQDLPLSSPPGTAPMRVQRFLGSPHVADMLVVYHGASGSLLQADLFSALTPFNATYAHFAQWVASHPLAPQRVVGVHHDPLSSSDLQRLARGASATR